MTHVGRRSLIASIVLLAAIAIALLARSPSSQIENSPAQPRDQPAVVVAAAPTQLPVESVSPAPAEQPASHSLILRGRVVDAVTREPVREFAVTLRPELPGRASDDSMTREYSDEAGEFEWPDLAEHPWVIRVQADGYQPFERIGVRASAMSKASHIEAALRPGATLRGRVVDETTRAGIASARINASDMGTPRFSPAWFAGARAETNKDGVFVLEGLPTGQVNLWINAPGYAHRSMAIAVTDRSPSVEIALSAGGKIAGRLTAADGVTPVTGRVGVFDLDEGMGSSSHTNESGAFSFVNLAPARYKLTAESSSGFVDREISLAPNQQITDLVLVMGTGGTIRGVVTGLSSEDLSRVTIQLAGAFGPSSNIPVDAKGAFAIQGVSPGPVIVLADITNRRQVRKAVHVTADADSIVTLEFPRGARLWGRITRNGTPVPGENVAPIPATQSGRFFLYGVPTRQDGSYVIEHVPPGEYTLRVGRYSSRAFSVSSDTELNIDIPNTSLTGRVLESSGEIPIGGADIHLQSAEDTRSGQSFSANTDDAGRYEINGVEEGKFLLTIYKAGYALHRERVSYPAPRDQHTIRLSRDEGVEMKIVAEDTGQPLRTVLVVETIDGRSALRFSMQLDEHGIGRLPAGLAGSSLSISSWNDGPTTVQNWNGEPLEVRIPRNNVRE